MPEPITVDEVIARLIVVERKISEVKDLVEELIEDGTIAEQ